MFHGCSKCLLRNCRLFSLKVAWKLQAPTNLFFVWERQGSASNSLTHLKFYKEYPTYYSWTTFRKLMLNSCYTLSVLDLFPRDVPTSFPIFGALVDTFKKWYTAVECVFIYKPGVFSFLLFSSSWKMTWLNYYQIKTWFIEALLWSRQLWIFNLGHSCSCLALEEIAVWASCLAWKAEMNEVHRTLS